MAAIGSKHGSYGIETGFHCGNHRPLITNKGDIALPMITGPKGVGALWVRKAGELCGKIVFEALSSDDFFGSYATDGDSGLIFSVVSESGPGAIYRSRFADDRVTKI